MSEQGLGLNAVITMEEYNTNYTNNFNSYITNIYFKSINGEKFYQYAILKDLSFYTFIDKLYNKICNDFGLNYNFELVPLTTDTEIGLELKEYLISNNYNINQITSTQILNINNTYYVRTNAEKHILYINIDRAECPVCYEVNILHKFYICYHKLCKKCYLNWESRLGTTCPICRSC